MNENTQNKSEFDNAEARAPRQGGKQAPRRGSQQKSKNRRPQRDEQGGRDGATPRAPRARAPQTEGGQPASRQSQAQGQANSSAQKRSNNNRRRQPSPQERPDRKGGEGDRNQPRQTQPQTNRTIQALQDARDNKPGQNARPADRKPALREGDGAHQASAAAQNKTAQNQRTNTRRNENGAPPARESGKQSVANQPKRVQQSQRPSRQRDNRPKVVTDPRKLAEVETVDDIRLEITQIEKEIKLELAEIGSIKLT